MGPTIITYSLYFITIASVIMAREIYLTHAQPINHPLVYFYVAFWFILNLSGRQALYHKRNQLSHLFAHFSWSSHNSFNSYYLYAIMFWLFVSKLMKRIWFRTCLFRTHHPDGQETENHSLCYSDQQNNTSVTKGSKRSYWRLNYRISGQPRELR